MSIYFQPPKNSPSPVGMDDRSERSSSLHKHRAKGDKILWKCRAGNNPSWMGLMILLQHQLGLNLFPFGVIKKEKRQIKGRTKSPRFQKEVKNKVVCVSLAPYLDNFSVCQPSSITQKELQVIYRRGNKSMEMLKKPIQSSIKSMAGTDPCPKIPVNLLFME